MLTNIKKSVLEILQLHPHGLGNDQLLWKLRGVMHRVSATDLLHALNALADSGQITRLHGRWVSSASIPKSPAKGGESNTTLNDALHAVFAKCIPVPEEKTADSADVIADGEAAPAPFEWSKLLRYYEATQRQDPRGTVEKFPDEHGKKWLLFTTSG